MKKIYLNPLIKSVSALLLVSFMACNNANLTNVVTEKSNDSLFLATAGSLAMNNPDQFNWEVFARICKIEASQQLVAGTSLKTNNATWETWADDELTYPQNPDPNNPPQFPVNDSNNAKILKPSTQQTIANHFSKQKNLFIELGGSEEVRRNKASFDFIINNKLWYNEGMALAFAKGTANNTYTPLSFPINAIEVKAMWKPITEAEKVQYHWNYDAAGKLFGLTALHIMTKAIPNWTWATWEWVGNNGRCDDMGCIDNFGVNPSVVNPHPGATNQPDPSITGKPYPGGQLTEPLLALFKKYGLADEWKNYRLKGSQIDWIDATGRPTLVGNSVTEKGFVATSSCITCHSVASFDVNGQINKSIGFDTTNLINNVPQSNNGAINPNNFWRNNKLVFYQGDFVWGILKANSIKN